MIGHEIEHIGRRTLTELVPGNLILDREAYP